jgi:tetratricopeptide (TPR) repeat protein
MRCPCDAAVLALSPAMADLDGLRIVLDWGKAPADLDAHLAFPGNHVYFLAKQGAGARLDVDSVRGRGPETITLAHRQPGVRYLYAVHDYSDKDDPRTDRLSRSGARVFVYVGQTLVRTYAVPAGTGNFWSVFAIGPDGEFQDLDVVKGVTSRDRLQTADFQDVIDHPAARPARLEPAAQTDAHAANAQGEAAYHAGRVDEAIAHYLQAIDLDAAYGQAYSNLGLAFQKAHRVAEAMWANRKAIALAQGPAAATVRASSHYNNGRIYESARQWDDALREYRAAQAETANPVYDHAIARMQQQGAR